MARYSGFFAKAATVLLVVASSVNAQYVAVAGLTGGVNPTSGARPVRQNIITFATSGAPWNLYVQALAAFQADNQSDLLSYYQIAGIHGRPYTAWDNVNGPKGIDYATGYCTHDSILFPVWHRPYLALFESTLYNYVQKIAATYTGSNAATYKAAATSWRMPYWDWASTPQMPSTVTTPTLQITGPSGLLTITNPLYNYTFHPLSTKDFPLNSGDAPPSIITALSTYRDANSNGVSNEAYVNQQLQAAGLTQSTYDVFTRATVYQNFSTQANSGSSIEAVHGTVHVTVGQYNGHMTYIPYSAFDPIFFLHHTNVDRLFAMWQAIYPNQYVGSQANQYGTFTEAGGTIENANTNLTPFTSKTDGSAYWTSTTSRTLKAFGYTYPEIQDWNQTAAQLQASVRASVNRLYSPGAATSTRSRNLLAGRSIFTKSEWFASICVDKFAVGGPFKLFLFIGSPPTDTTAWATASNLVALQGYFSPVAPVGSMPPMLTYSQVNLKQAFNLPDSPLAIAAANLVIPFLAKKLQWGVQKVDGTIVQASDIPSLQIHVQEESYSPPSDATSFPRYGLPVIHPEITRGKIGGFHGH